MLTVLRSHSDLFINSAICIPSNSSLEMTPFLQATKQYLCLSLSRNAVSTVNQVFELSVEIFWCMLKSMRAQMKVSCCSFGSGRNMSQADSDFRKRSRYFSTKSLFLFSKCDILLSVKNPLSSPSSSGFVKIHKPSSRSISTTIVIELHPKTYTKSS